MDKRIALCFLSRFNTERETKKLILSKYSYIDTDGSQRFMEGWHTNEPALKIFARQSLDKVFLFVTKADRENFVYSLGIDSDINDTLHTDTHLELFKQTMERDYPGITEKFVEVNYDEEEDVSSLAKVLNMSGEIKGYVEQELAAGNKISLSVDMTGGLRNANMLLLVLTGLLEYAGINLKQILYTYYDSVNKIGKVMAETEVHNLSKLVAGADAFIKYGRSDGIEEYFKNIREQSEKLKDLLSAMREIADALSMCRSGVVKECIAKLSDALSVYKATNPGNVYEQTFKILLGRIEHEYQEMLSGVDNPLKIILWCAKRGFIQQAMTFYTEWVPTYLVANKILYLKKDSDISNCIETKEEYTPWEKHMLANWQKKKENRLTVTKNGGAYDNIDRSVAIYNEDFVHQNLEIWDRIKQFTTLYKTINKIDRAEDVIKKCFNDSPSITRHLVNLLYYDCFLCELRTKSSLLTKLKNKLGDTINIIKYLHKYKSNSPLDFNCYLETNVNTLKLFNMIGSCSKNQICEMFEIEIKNIVKQEDIKRPRTPDEKIAERMKVLNAYLEDGTISSDYSIEDATICAENYTRVRQWRNEINHASTSLNVSSKEVNDLMLSSIEHIEKLLNRKNEVC